MDEAREYSRVAQVRFLLFAGPREAVGQRSVAVDVPDGATVAEGVDALVQAWPTLARWRSSALLSVNMTFVLPDEPLADGDEVAFMPPVSGGAEAPRTGIRDAPFSLDEAAALLGRDGAGAAVYFVGLVRAESTALAERTDALEFEAYAPMAEQELAAVRDRALKKFALVDAMVWHRLGRLETGEDIVLVGVTAAHRAAAFDAARAIMDDLKTVVPVWKKEIGPAGERWVNDPAGDA